MSKDVCFLSLGQNCLLSSTSPKKNSGRAATHSLLQTECLAQETLQQMPLKAVEKAAPVPATERGLVSLGKHILRENSTLQANIEEKQ